MSCQCDSKCTVEVAVCQLTKAAASQEQEKSVCYFPTAGKVGEVNPEVMVTTPPTFMSTVCSGNAK